MNTMCKFLIPIMVICLLTSCGSSKKAQGVPGEVELTLPCSGPDFQSNNEYFRATQNGLSTDMSTAKTKALTLARAELATSMNALVERTNDNYVSSYQSGEQEEAKGRMNDMSRIIVRETLSDSRIICEKMMRSADGKYRCYITVETSKENILNALSGKMKNNERILIDFEYEKYKKIFDEEMSKFGN